LHGEDGAFYECKAYYETLQMVNFNEYNVGSTIHIIINNQIGFATALAKNRCVMYVSDLANYNAQIFNINADCIKDVHHTFKTVLCKDKIMKLCSNRFYWL